MLVIETASVLAGPSVGMFLAELGATVIKIENPKTGGDVTRSWKLSTESSKDDVSAYFASVNWGKKSISLDFNNASDMLVLQTLISKADILLQSFKYGDDIKFGLQAEQLLVKNPTLIIAEINGFGHNENRVAYDAIIQAESGYMYMNGEKNSQALKMPVALIDVLAAHHLKEGILLALLEKNQTSKGKIVRVSLLKAAISSLVNQANNYLQAGSIPKAMGSEHPNIFPYGLLIKSQDDKDIVIAVSSNKQFKSLCDIIQLNANAELTSTNKTRVANRDALRVMILQKAKQFSYNYLCTELQKAHVPFGAIRNMAEVFELDAAQELVLNSNGKTGLRTALSIASTNKLTPPPKLNQDKAWLDQFMASIK